MGAKELGWEALKRCYDDNFTRLHLKISVKLQIKLNQTLLYLLVDDKLPGRSFLNKKIEILF